MMLFPSMILSMSFMVSSALFLFFNFIIYVYFPLMSHSSLELSVSIILDWMSLLFSATVTLISSMIMMYSHSYIPSNDHKRFSLILLSFIISMILLIFSNNVFFMMLGWDGLGLSSYILVIFYQNSKSSESGAITILSNRIGDINIILAISMITFLGSWEFSSSFLFPILIILLISLAAFTKSAQFPFSAWLPAAMAAPTPISALVHSSTLVTAGVFILLRVLPLNLPLSSFMIMLVSSITMFLAGMSANWEQDLKKIIALSTLSQIAFMMFAISLNSFTVAFFHLITHALFKSTLFLCAGAIIHNSSYQDMRNHGASTNSSPPLILSLGICNMALMGLPFMAGFFSKDLIIETFLSNSSMNSSILLTIMFSVGLTSSYSIRLSLFSSNLTLKSSKDKLFHLDKFMLMSISLLTPISSFLGALIMWLIIPAQHFILPFSLKFMTILTISLGLTIGLSLSFKNSFFKKMGEPSLSLWFLHFISCIPLLNIMKKSNMLWHSDKSWMETLGPSGSMKSISSMSPYPDTLTFFLLMPLSMFMSIPIMFTLL